ncbi:MAG: CYTH domain-containing protein [Ruminococcus sp.]|nr:CYTH domain-containing protein [Ruminococcus sp.]
MLEKEVKILLTKEEYELIERSFDFATEIEQLNRYYTCSACVEKRISVRVREIGGRALLQAKVPVAVTAEEAGSGSLMVREEIEKELTAAPVTIPAELIMEICGTAEEARQLGSLRTVRKLCYDYEGIELALDLNEYLGITDYELEAEYTGSYPTGLLAELKALGIDTEKPAHGKYSRFCYALESDTKEDAEEDTEPETEPEETPADAKDTPDTEIPAPGREE